MSGYFPQVQAEAHAADLAEQARRARLLSVARTDRPRPGRLRHPVSRLLVGLAARLDHRHRPSAVPVPTCGPGA